MTEEEMLLVNGGEKAKDETVVTVESGDTLSELTAKLNEQNGTDYTYEEIALLNGITDPDTIYAGQTIVFPGTSQPESGSDSGSSGDTPSSPSSSNSTNDATANTVKGPEHHSAYDQQYINEMMENSRKNALGGNGIQGTAVSGKRFSTNASLYSPNDPNPDKRYNGQNYYNEQTKTTEHLMIVNSADKFNYRNIRDYYLTVGQYGSAGTIKYDGIGITNRKGEMIEIQKDEKSIAEYSKKIGIPVGTVMDTISTVGDFAGNSSTATGFASILTESEKLGDVSNVLGWASFGVDIIQAFNDPTFSNWYDVAADGAGFIPVVGPYVSSGMVAGKEAVELTASAIEHDIDYKFYDKYGLMLENNNAYGMGIGTMTRPMMHGIEKNIRGLLGIGR